MTAAGLRARISPAGIVAGTISEYTWHSRTRRAISWAYCAPKSTTSTVSKSSACTTSPSRVSRTRSQGGMSCSLGGALTGRRPGGLLARGVSAGRRAGGLLARRRAGGIPARRAIGIRLAHPAHPDPRNAPAVQLGHGELVPVHLHLGADPGQLAELGEYVAGHRLVRALGQPHAGLLGELVQVQQPVHLELAVTQLGRAVLLDVVLVLDLADQLLDQVLQGHDAGGPPVLVHHDRHVRPVPP